MTPAKCLLDAIKAVIQQRASIEARQVHHSENAKLSKKKTNELWKTANIF